MTMAAALRECLDEVKKRVDRRTERDLNVCRAQRHDIGACTELWLAMLRQALDDMRIDVADVVRRVGNTLSRQIEIVEARWAVATAAAWFESDDIEPGSFLWVCEQVGRDPDGVRRVALSGRA